MSAAGAPVEAGLAERPPALPECTQVNAEVGHELFTLGRQRQVFEAGGDQAAPGQTVERLHTKVARQKAYDLCSSLFAADGNHTLEESEFGKHIKTIFEL